MYSILYIHIWVPCFNFDVYSASFQFHRRRGAGWMEVSVCVAQISICPVNLNPALHLLDVRVTQLLGARCIIVIGQSRVVVPAAQL